MSNSQARIRTRIAVTSGVVLVLLCSATWRVFASVNHGAIVLRDVQRGHQAPDQETLATLARAATDQLSLADQYAVLDILQSQGQDAMAEPILRCMASSDAGAPELHLRWADTLSRLGRHEQAETQYAPLLATPTEITREIVLLRMARNANHAGWLAQAIQRYRQYLEQAPDDREARSELAGVLLSFGRKTEAIEEYRRLSQSEPDEVKWLLALADTALTESDATVTPSLDDLRAARRALETALTIEDARATQRKLAVVLSWLDEHAKALSLLRECGPPTLDETEACRAYAQALSITGGWTPQEREAFTQLGQAALERPDAEAKLLAALARAMRAMDEMDLAARLFGRAVERDSDNRMVRFEFANLLHEMERFRDADVHYQVLLDESGAGER